METALRRIADMLGAFADAVAAWFATGAWRPEAWPGITWVLVGAFLVLSWLLAWRRRAPRALDVRPPQLLVTSGEVVPDGTDEPAYRPSGRRRRRSSPEAHGVAGGYTMTVSNLSRYPVQLLEVALRDGRRGAPQVAAVDAVVPAMGSVSVSGRIPLGLRGDGWLDLYCYAAAPRVKMHRHRVELVWEPWAARFKAAPLEQVSVPARRLASDEPDARFLEDEAPEVFVPAPVAPAAVAAAERRAGPPRGVAFSAPSEEPPPPAHAPAAPAAAPEAVVLEAPVAAPPAPHAPTPAPPAAPVVAAPRPKAAPPTPRTGARPASPAAGAPEGVPRIGTQPVGVAVAGRGGAAARTADGLPIGRPTARPDRSPSESAEPVRDAASDVAPAQAPSRAPEAGRRAPTPVRPPARAVPERPEAPAAPPRAPRAPQAAPAAATKAASADEAPPEPPAEPPARRRPRLEFPDEF